MLRTLTATTVLALLFQCGAAAADQGPWAGRGARVIPPGQDRLIGTLGGAGGVDVAGCTLASVAIERHSIALGYSCGADTHRLELWPADRPGEAHQRSERFALVVPDGATPPAALVDAVSARVREHEAGFRWLEVAQEVSEAAGVDAATVARFREAEALAGKKDYAGAAPIFLELARTNPRLSGVLGRLVSSIGASEPSAELVARYAAAADADATDVVAQFAAGVAAHYSAHYTARTGEDKRALYAQAIRSLERTRPKLDFEPRVFIYLAVSHFRLGQQAQAEALIEQAVAMDAEDPDAYYCRAEIFHRAEVSRSLDDLETYLRLTEPRADPGAAGKIERVQGMRDYLKRVQAGERELEELWDPLASTAPGSAAAPGSDSPPLEAAASASRGGPQPDDAAQPEPSDRSRLAFGIALALAALALLFGYWTLARRRRS